MSPKDLDDAFLDHSIRYLIEQANEDPSSFEGELIAQQIYTSLKLLKEDHDTGQIKLITRALKEMRYAYHIFNKYKDSKCVSIFGSARTPEDHPDYLAAKLFSKKMAENNWMCITGGANGIMKAGLEGPEKKDCFGLSIRLPFETSSNSIIAGDPKLIVFRYFFTRKLMFMSHSNALAAFPGGFGTLDELFEVLTLMQTGKASIIPVVLIEGVRGSFWEAWDSYMNENLYQRGWTSVEDKHFYKIFNDIDEAVLHIKQFYKRFNSYRYLRDDLVIRIESALSEEQVAELNREFKELIVEGQIEQRGAFEEEAELMQLPRLVFKHNYRHYGLLRAMIDRINTF